MKSDKLKHFGIGFGIGFAFAFIVPPIGFVVSAIVGHLKEYLDASLPNDHKLRKKYKWLFSPIKTKYDNNDFFATIAGGLAGCVVQALFFNHLLKSR